MPETIDQAIKERVYAFCKKLNLAPISPYIEKADLSPESNAFLNILAAVVAYFVTPAGSEIGQKDLFRIARESYEMLAINFGGDVPYVIQDNFIIKSNEADIRVKLYKKDEKATEKLILYAHGGGWTRGSLGTHHTLCARFCDKTGWDVLAVDYRLAPEHPYPAALNDLESVYHWAQQHYQQVALSGDSAGGNLVTALTHRLRHNKLQQPIALLLIYPSLDLRIIQDDKNPYAHDYFLTRDRINQFIKDYLQHNLVNATNDPQISPILEKNLEDFPYTIIVSSECDPLCEEAKEFASKLNMAGNKVDHLIIPKVLHAFAQFFDLYPEAEKCLDYLAEKIILNSKLK